MATEFERSIREVTRVYRESRGLPPLKGEEIPTSLREGHLSEVLTGSVPKGGDSGKQSL